MVGRDVLGAPRTWGRHGDAIRRAGRRGRRPLPRAHGAGPYHAPHGRARRPRRAAYMETPTGTPSGARAAEDVGPYHAHMVPARSTNPMVGRDVLGAPRTWGRHGDAIRRAGRRGRRPLPRAHGAGPYHAPHGRARRPRRAAYMETPTGTPSGARAAEDVGPSHAHMVPARTTHAPICTRGGGPFQRPAPRAVRVLRAPAHRPQVAVILKSPAGGAKEVKRPALRTRNLI